MKFKLSQAVSKNRAEEFPDDLWGQYVLPLEYETANLHNLTKGAVIVGGRGSGKTMFLKYHCHATAFSKNRRSLPDDIFKQIGLYWKPDTSFTQLISEGWLGKSWASVFNSYATICVLLEFCKMCTNISTSHLQDKAVKDKFKKIRIPEVIANDLSIEPKSLSVLGADIGACLYRLSNWVNFPDSEIPPYNLGLKITIKLLIEHLKNDIPELENTTFNILIDEFENLAEEQQKIINTLLKHGEQSLIFCIAYKKYAIVSNDTMSQEKIQNIDDYRYIDLENVYFNKINPKLYEVLATEILALKLIELLPKKISKDIVRNYSNPEMLKFRKDKEYQTAISGVVDILFKSVNRAEMSRGIFEIPPLLKKLKTTLIQEGLKKHNNDSFTIDDFIDSEFPEASIVNGALLNRKSIKVDDLKKEFELYKIKKGDKYTGWINNNLYGVILYLYNTLPQRVCPIYSGFNAFILMSRGNLRHFLELCFYSFIRVEAIPDFKLSSHLPIDVDIQGKGTKMTSSAQLEKIEELGSNGIHLKRLASRLGVIFSLSQNRKSQSEPEVNHFTIDTSDISLLNKQTSKLLREATVWSVLFEEEGTKAKSSNDIEATDYILHPVLSCQFGISPRKKRKLKFNAKQMQTICYGDERSFKELKNHYIKLWDLDDAALGTVEPRMEQSGQLSLL